MTLDVTRKMKMKYRQGSSRVVSDGLSSAHAMKAEACRRVMARLLPDVAMVGLSSRGWPLYVELKHDGHRHWLSDGLRRALAGLLVELGEQAPPTVRVW